MTVNDLIGAIVSVHNRLVTINVHGDDVITMASILQECRQIASQYAQDQQKDEQPPDSKE